MQDLGYYILNDDKTTQKVSLENFCKHHSTEDDRKVVMRTDLPDGSYVVTAFFGMDHRDMAAGTCLMDDKPSDDLPEDLPILFGTMIFGGPKNHDE
jgi:hypothetical protein